MLLPIREELTSSSSDTTADHNDLQAVLAGAVILVDDENLEPAATIRVLETVNIRSYGWLDNPQSFYDLALLYRKIVSGIDK